METIQAVSLDIIEAIGWLIDMAGVLIIVVGIIIATVTLMTRGKRHAERGRFRTYRQNIARSVLLGLEFLVAGDIIRTVAGDLTLEGMAVLGGIVLIRVVLGISLEAEIAGVKPWTLLARVFRQKDQSETSSKQPATKQKRT